MRIKLQRTALSPKITPDDIRTHDLLLSEVRDDDHYTT
jgi:hypothetical protein